MHLETNDQMKQLGTGINIFHSQTTEGRKKQSKVQTIKLGSSSMLWRSS
jgi:hypothetical protein